MLWPYDEVSLDIQTETGLIAFKSPWMVATLPGDVMDAATLNELAASLNQRVLTSSDLIAVNALFQHVESYPFAYTLPSDKPHATDHHTIADDTLLSGDILDLFNRVVALSQPHGVDFTVADIEALFASLPRQDWEWDHSAAIAFATFRSTVHPESLFSVAKRFHLLEIIATDRGKDIFRQAQSLDDADFKKIASRLVRQNHYVTQMCQRALRPAQEIAQSASTKVEHFRDEEKGHDKLLERTLRTMGLDPESVPVSVYTRALMLLLEFCARRNFLAFSMAVDAFERSNYSEADPLAELLMSRGFDNAAKYINAHKNINDHGNHEHVARDFIYSMDLCSEQYAMEAIRLMELISLFMCLVSSAPISD